MVACSANEVVYSMPNNKLVFYNLNKDISFELKDITVTDVIDDNYFIVSSSKGMNVVTDKGDFLFKDWKKVITYVNKNFICVDGKYLFNLKNKTLKYTGEIMLPENDGIIPCIDEKSKKIGYFDRNGKMIIPVKYDSGTYFTHGYAVVKEKDNIEIINKNCDIIYKTNDNLCKGIQILSPKMALITMEEDNQLLYSLKEHKTIRSEKYLQLASSNYLIFTKNGLFGLLDIDGKEVIKPIYTEAGFVKDNYIIFGKKDGKYIIKKLDSGINPFEDKEFDILLRKGNYFANMDFENGNYTIIDKHGKIVLNDVQGEFNVRGDFISIFNDDGTMSVYFKNRLLGSHVKKLFTFTSTMVIFEKQDELVIYRTKE